MPGHGDGNAMTQLGVAGRQAPMITEAGGGCWRLERLALLTERFTDKADLLATAATAIGLYSWDWVEWQIRAG